MIRPDDPNQILKYIAYAVERGHAPTWQELEVVADFTSRGGRYRCLEALHRIAVMELAAKRGRKAS